MLQSIRDKITGGFAMVFLGAIAIVFIFWGVDMGSNSGARYAAKVDGEGIAVETVRQSWQLEEQELQRQIRGPIPEQLAKAQQQNLLDRYIRITLLKQRATNLGYRVSDAALRESIAANPNWQADGKFAPERYAFEATQRRISTAQLDQETRQQVQINQLIRGIATSAFVTPSELSRRTALEGEQRAIDYAVIPASAYLASVNITDAQIQSWYEAHLADYMTNETADLEYLELKLADAGRDVPVTDEALQAYYEQAKERLTTVERRRVRHILITAVDGVDDATAQKTAADILAKLQAGGDFAALAKQFSKDPTTATLGGDLGWKLRDELDGPFQPLQDALFSMSKGELRGPIKTQFGYHIVRLDETEGGQTKTFAEARAELESEYRAEKAQALFYERSQKLADESFKALTELTTVAAALNVPVQKVSGFTRQGGGVFGNDPKVIEAVFRDEALVKGENSSLLALGDDRAVVLRVSAHQPPTQLPQTAVRTQIEFKLKDQAAKEAAAKRGGELLARLNAGDAWTAVLAEAKLATIGQRTIGRTDGTVPAPVRLSAFDVPRSSVQSKAAYRGTATEDGGFAIVAVTSVQAGVLESGTPESAAKLRQTAQAQGNAEFSAYLDEVERGAKIERNPKVFE